jgi:hypothetical protein
MPDSRGSIRRTARFTRSAGDHAELGRVVDGRSARLRPRSFEGFFALLPGGRPAGDRDVRDDQLEDAKLGEDAFEDAYAALEQQFRSSATRLRSLPPRLGHGASCARV